MKKILFVALCALLLSNGMYGQRRFALKTNVPYWGTLSPNVGAEMVLRDNFTLELSGGFNPFSFSNDRQWKHWLLWTEVRYWVWEPFSSHFFGLHYVTGGYNAGGANFIFDTFSGARDRRAVGNVNGIGLSYGHSWIIGNNLALEATIGAGFARFNYAVYPLGRSGERERERGNRNFWGPTKGGISLVYVFR